MSKSQAQQSAISRRDGARGLNEYPLDECCDIAVPRSANQVALPVAWDRTIFNRCRSFSDGYGILNLAESVPFQAGVPGAADRAFRSQVLKQLFFQHAARLDEQAAIDRLV